MNCSERAERESEKGERERRERERESEKGERERGERETTDYEPFEGS